MRFSPSRLYRRLRFGRPIVVVSGLPRSGTSMMMRMLRAGGLELVMDGTRAADSSNPEGYFELEQVKTLDKTDRRSPSREPVPARRPRCPGDGRRGESCALP